MSAPDGLRLEMRRGLLCMAVRVQPRSSRERVLGVHDGALKVALTAPPVDDRANRQLVDFLGRLAGVGRARVRLVSGHKGRLKWVGFESISGPDLKKRLSQHLV